MEIDPELLAELEARFSQVLERIRSCRGYGTVQWIVQIHDSEVCHTEVITSDKKKFVRRHRVAR